jgi:hypothetical protein
MSTDRNRTSRVLLGFAVAALLLAACGDDDSEDVATSTTSSEPSTSAPPLADGEVEAVDEDGGDFCQLNHEIAGLFGELAQIGSEEIWADIEAVVAQMQDASPPGLEAEVATAIGYYPIARAELEAANWDVSVLDSFEMEPDHARAEQNITAYLDANC